MMGAPDPAKLALNAITVKQWPLDKIIEGCARHGIRGISPWRNQIAAMGLKEAVRAINDHGLEVPGLCRGGFFHEKNWLDDNRRAIEEAHALEAQALILVVGTFPEGTKDLAHARERIQESISRLLPEARAAGVPLAIEPLHPMQTERALVNTLEQALDMCDALGEGVGVAVDVYHVWWDPKLEEQIRRAGRQRLLGYHICDWRVPTRDLFNDRAMMGDGVIDLPRIRGYMEAAGYRGFHEVEIFSEQDWWKREPEEVLKVCRDRFATKT